MLWGYGHYKYVGEYTIYGHLVSFGYSERIYE